MQNTFRLLITVAVLLVCIGSIGCKVGPEKKVWESDGLRVEYFESTGVLQLSTATDDLIVIPTSGFILQTNGTQFWDLDGTQYRPLTNDKLKLLDFADTVVLRPGMSIDFQVIHVGHAALVIDIQDLYLSEVKTYFKRSFKRMWFGKLTLQP